MSKRLQWAWLAAASCAVAAACGGSGSTGGIFPGGEEAGAEAGGGGEAGSSSGISSGGGEESGSGGTSSGADASTGSSSGTTSSSGGPSDATLDIPFPDVFYGPDTAAPPDSGSPQESGPGCSPLGITCSGSVATACLPVDGGSELTTTDCSTLNPPETCSNGFGCVVCQPGTGSCSGSVGTACNSNGSGYTTNDCDSALGETCNGATGQCEGDCANLGESYIGCEYYAVTMANSLLDQTTFSFAVSIDNTSPTKAANVTITGPSGFSTTGSIAAGGISVFTLPWDSTLSNGNASTQAVAGGAYHIRSTEPIAAYQFNPKDYTLNGSYSYTNDASLLLPVNAMTQTYYVVSGATWDAYTGTVAIVATQNGTTVNYAAPGGNAIVGGAGLGASGGTSTTLNAGDVLQISAAANGGTTSFGSDQSGAYVTANAPIEVFSGVDCTNMPANVQYCDHIEEIVLPVETLRSDYLVVVPQNDYATSRQYVKIVGTQANTTLTYDPPVSGAPATLQAGQSSFFQALGVDFHVTSSAPILVGQFMESQNNFGGTCYNSLDNTLNCGDPSESIAVATAQFRSSYQFIAPPSYNESYVSIIAPNGASVTVDGTAHNSGTAIGGSGYWTTPVKLCGGGAVACSSTSGVHTATSTAPFGIEVYGYGAYTSYMYPGGLNLTRQ